MTTTNERVSIVLDSFLINQILNGTLVEEAYQLVRDEVKWCEMYHKGGPVPRQIAIQGDTETLVAPADEEGDSIRVEPFYRHPADRQPALQEWTPCVRKLRDVVQQVTGQTINHALIQMYRNGDDYISEHADKSLDIARDSIIFNLSLGSTRTMVLRDKREQENGVKTPLPRKATRVPLHHGSLFGLGWHTNLKMTHEIKRDKRQDFDKTDQELGLEYDHGCRISLTFRHVATFLAQTVETRVPLFLYGQGAKHKTLKQAREAAVLNKRKLPTTDAQESERLIQAFSEENRRSAFDWNATYGEGFNVINIEIVDH